MKWGIIGAGKIAHRFATACLADPENRILAVSARNPLKGQIFCQQFGIEKTYQDPQQLLQEMDIEAVYIALPHGLHQEWVIKACQAGKAVLCEKPLAINASQVAQIIEIQKQTGVLVMEAMKTRFIPLYQYLKEEIIGQGLLGTIQKAYFSLCNQMDLEGQNSYHMQAGQGGALLDCGIYCAAWIQDYFSDQLRLVDQESKIYRNVDVYSLSHFK